MRRSSAPVVLVVLGLLLGLLPASPAAAIVGGDPAEPGEWPWQVSIQVQGTQYCGGSLLSYSVVLTAAHCTDGMRAADFTVIAGTVDIRDGSAGQHRRVTEIRQHEDFDAFSVRNDIALLIVDSPFEPSDGLRPVSIPDATTEGRLTRGGSPAVITGFGRTGEQDDTSDRLLEADVQVIDDQRCTIEFAQDGTQVFGDSQVCAGRERGHVGACFGDSGGPLVVPAGPEEDEWYLVGIVSWGAGCAQAFRPTVFTEVTSFVDWLVDHGAAGVEGERFESDGAVRVPAVGTRGKAGPYPSVVDVDGFDGPVTGVAVELRGLSHGRPEDIDMWLQAPDGTIVTLLSDRGGSLAMSDRAVTIVAGAPGAADGPLAIQVGPADVEPDPQRGGDAPAADLDELAGVEADGQWRLYVADDETGAAGVLQGWTLILR